MAVFWRGLCGILRVFITEVGCRSHGRIQARNDDIRHYAANFERFLIRAGRDPDDFIGRETYHLAMVLFVNNDQSSSYLLIEGIVIYFLYFEFVP